MVDLLKFLPDNDGIDDFLRVDVLLPGLGPVNELVFILAGDDLSSRSEKKKKKKIS